MSDLNLSTFRPTSLATFSMFSAPSSAGSFMRGRGLSSQALSQTACLNSQNLPCFCAAHVASAGSVATCGCTTKCLYTNLTSLPYVFSISSMVGSANRQNGQANSAASTMVTLADAGPLTGASPIGTE